MEPPKKYIVSGIKCARCGQYHELLEFTGFKENPVLDYTAWALCPTHQEPVLLQIVIDPKLEHEGKVEIKE